MLVHPINLATGALEACLVELQACHANGRAYDGRLARCACWTCSRRVASLAQVRPAMGVEATGIQAGLACPAREAVPVPQAGLD